MGRRQVRELCVDYYLLSEDVESIGERYGIQVTCKDEAETIFGITISQIRILSLLRRLMDGLVTPSTVRDVVEDWIVRIL